MLFIFVVVRIVVAVIDYRKEKKQHDENNKPDNGSVRLLVITEKQYEKMEARAKNKHGAKV